MTKEQKMDEKKLRGSGGYVVARITDQEQKMANLGGPELFLAGVGRLENDRFEKYYCNNCEKEYSGTPNVEFENPDEDLGENIILIEKGEYKCKSCNYVLAQYRKFDETGKNEESNNLEDRINAGKSANKTASNTATMKSKDIAQGIEKEEEEETGVPMNMTDYRNSKIENKVKSESNYLPIEEIIGMLAYDNNAHLLGKVSEIGLRRISEGNIQFSFKISNADKEIMEVTWNDISKIGDIIILGDKKTINKSTESSIEDNVNYSTNNTNNITKSKNSNFKLCENCNHNNDIESIFCEECGRKLVE